MTPPGPETLKATESAAGAGPLPAYLALVEAGRLEPEPPQQALAETLQSVYEALLHSRPLLSRLFRRPRPVAGLYVHGSVGRGKTLLMDLLAVSLEQAQVSVRRIHFHRFMDEVHEGLNGLGGTRDPLSHLAGRMARRARVLCFDEFHVSDIGDAMILAELLAGLFARGVTLVATSNTAPENLYADGLQRARFLPAIDLIREHCRIVALEDGRDFRLRQLTRHPVYYTPVNPDTVAGLAAEFDDLASGEAVSTAPLKVRARQLELRRRAGSVVWFDFDQLCGGPRASGDYIELARRFSTVLVSHVPAMDDRHNDQARRFVHLVDECYDRNVKMILLAQVPVDQLYSGERLAGPFERTVSRLIEMQSVEYLGRPHRP